MSATYEQLTETASIYYLAAKAVILNSEGNILLLQKSASNRNGDHWDLPGGRVRNEDLEAALRREVLEETGLSVTVGRAVGSAVFHERIRVEGSAVGLIAHAFACQAESEAEPTLDNEHQGFRWVRPDEAATLLAAAYPAAFTQAVRSA